MDGLSFEASRNTRVQSVLRDSNIFNMSLNFPRRYVEKVVISFVLLCTSTSHVPDVPIHCSLCGSNSNHHCFQYSENHLQTHFFLCVHISSLSRSDLIAVALFVL